MHLCVKLLKMQQDSLCEAQHFSVPADTSLPLIYQIIEDSSKTLLILFRSDISRIQIDRTAVHESIQRQKANQADPYSMYHSKALQAELRHLDAQERLDKQE